MEKIQEFQEKEKSKYELGFTEQTYSEEDLLDQAKKQADFYLNECAKEGDADIPHGMIALVHFFNHPDIITNRVLKNNSKFFSKDINYLKDSGFDIGSVQEKFDAKERYVVAMPINKLDTWTNTRSWLKLSKAGSLKKAAIFFVPKEDVIFREHKYIETTFHNLSDEESYKENAFKYYNSSQKITDDIPDLAMPEAWIPHSISLDDAKILEFEK